MRRVSFGWVHALVGAPGFRKEALGGADRVSADLEAARQKGSQMGGRARIALLALLPCDSEDRRGSS